MIQAPLSRRGLALLLPPTFLDLGFGFFGAGGLAPETTSTFPPSLVPPSLGIGRLRDEDSSLYGAPSAPGVVYAPWSAFRDRSLDVPRHCSRKIPRLPRRPERSPVSTSVVAPKSGAEQLSVY